jgi:hypothetical protein
LYLVELHHERFGHQTHIHSLLKVQNKWMLFMKKVDLLMSLFGLRFKSCPASYRRTKSIS